VAGDSVSSSPEHLATVLEESSGIQVESKLALGKVLGPAVMVANPWSRCVSDNGIPLRLSQFSMEKMNDELHWMWGYLIFRQTHVFYGVLWDKKNLKHQLFCCELQGSARVFIHTWVFSAKQTTELCSIELGSEQVCSSIVQ